jgi:hypothetical protein
VGDAATTVSKAGVQEEMPAPLSGRNLNWHDRLQVLYGVLLSASLGAFAASSPPSLLVPGDQSSAYIRNTTSRLWIVLAIAILLVAFDAWYQFAVNGSLLLSGKREINSLIIFILIPSMVWTSFLPFQMLLRSLNTDMAPWLYGEPGARLFGYSLIVCMVVEGALVLLAGVEILGDSRPGARVSFSLQMRQSFAAFMRLIIGVPALLITMIFIGDSPASQITHVMWLMSVWLTVRLIETAGVHIVERRSRGGL